MVKQTDRRLTASRHVYPMKSEHYAKPRALAHGMRDYTTCGRLPRHTTQSHKLWEHLYLSGFPPESLNFTPTEYTIIN